MITSRLPLALLLAAGAARADAPSLFERTLGREQDDCQRAPDADVLAAAVASPAIFRVELSLPAEVELDARGPALRADSAVALNRLAQALGRLFAANAGAVLEIAVQAPPQDPAAAVAAQARASLVRAYLMAQGLPFTRLRPALEFAAAPVPGVAIRLAMPPFGEPVPPAR